MVSHDRVAIRLVGFFLFFFRSQRAVKWCDDQPVNLGISLQNLFGISHFSLVPMTQIATIEILCSYLCM